MFDGGAHAHQRGPGDDGMADIEFAKPWNACDAFNVTISQPVSAVNFQAALDAGLYAAIQPVDFALDRARRFGVGVAPVHSSTASKPQSAEARI